MKRKHSSHFRYEKEESKTTFTIAIIIILLIALIVLGVIYVYKEKNKEVESPKREQTKTIETLRLDASLLTQPLTDAYIKGLDKFSLTADYSDTDQAYTKLINKEVDLIVVTAPNNDELERAKQANVELEITPVAKEGFVFYTNKTNEINDIALTDIQKIYTGEITNWQQIGNIDAPIIAYQHPTNSESQASFLSLVMKDQILKEPTPEEYIERQAGIIDAIVGNENGAYSIGYSYYYYATAMHANDNLKIFSINGIYPNHDAIKNSSYPLVTSYYIVTIKGDNREDLIKLKEEMLSSNGQNIVSEAGYIELG